MSQRPRTSDPPADATAGPRPCPHHGFQPKPGYNRNFNRTPQPHARSRLVAVQTGLRVSELIGLDCGDVTFGDGASVRCLGKDRKRRAVPLTTATQAVLRGWLAESDGRADQPLLPTRTGRRLSVDAVERLVRLHAATAARTCPTIRPEQLHPHVLRHSCAMSLLQAGVDTAVIALWLGHADPRSTSIYLHADMTIKQRALDATTPPSTAPGRYQPGDKLLAFLESL
ncbi:tyrosine-type recombinase/integrase [Amycolatopsis sp. NBC_01488]